MPHRGALFQNFEKMDGEPLIPLFIPSLSKTFIGIRKSAQKVFATFSAAKEDNDQKN